MAEQTRNTQEEQELQIIEKVVTIKRVTKVTKGGKNMSFTALVVVGDGNGRVGYHLGKANEVASAIRKGLAKARSGMKRYSIKNSTLPHDIIGKAGAAKVLMRSASEGTGVIAAGSVRAVCEAVGIRNILTKCLGSNNPINMVKATVDGLSRLKSAVLAADSSNPSKEDKD